MRNLVRFVVTGMLAASSVHADPPKYTRKQHVEIDVKLSSRVRPIAPVAPAPAKPVVTADAIMRIKERQQPLRREQEDILTKLVIDTPDDDPEKPDYLFRLAEHYAEQLRFWRLKAIAPLIPAHAH
jgi:hypothetical protein